MNEEVAEAGGKEKSELGTSPVDGGVFELFELLGLMDPAVDPTEDSFAPQGHLLLATTFRPFPAIAEGL